MTAAPIDLLTNACRAAELSPVGARLLRAHSASVYLLPADQAVARISIKEHEGLRAKASVALTHWLVERGFPATEPIIDHPIEVEDATVTFWRYYPQHDRGVPPARELGAILRQLHALPRPPFELPAYRPLLGLTTALESTDNALTDDDRAWLNERATTVIEGYSKLASQVGVGFVHGDAYAGNTLWGPDRALLGDWDEASIAPRELDLVNTYQNVRFGENETELDAFARAYGWDVRDWDGFTLLRDMRDLHTLTSYVRRSGIDPSALRELRLRLESLRNPGKQQLWHAA